MKNIVVYIHRLHRIIVTSAYERDIQRTHEVPREHPDAGMSTVEYAIGTIAAAAFAGILYKIVTGGEISDSLTHIIVHALNFAD